MGRRLMRSAIIGTGFIGEVHARAVRAAGGVLTAVAASAPSRSAQAAVRLHAQRPATVGEIVAADDVDIVHVCTPNYLHVRIAEAALQVGKHVICEKPLALDLADARRLATAAADAGVIAAVPFVYRFYSMVRETRDRVSAGEIGTVHLLHGGFLQDWLCDRADSDWRVDPAMGGASRAFSDIGVHWCDLVEFVSGHRIARLSARMTTVHVDRGSTAKQAVTEDAAAVLFETDRGAMGSVLVSQVSPGRKCALWYSLDGTRASVSFDQASPEVLWLGGRDQSVVLARGVAPTSSSARYDWLPPGHTQGYQDCFSAFVGDVYAAVRGSVPEGLPVFADGLRAAQLTDAVLRSSVRGEWIEVT